MFQKSLYRQFIQLFRKNATAITRDEALDLYDVDLYTDPLPSEEEFVKLIKKKKLEFARKYRPDLARAEALKEGKDPQTAEEIFNEVSHQLGRSNSAAALLLNYFQLLTKKTRPSVVDADAPTSDDPKLVFTIDTTPNGVPAIVYDMPKRTLFIFPDVMAMSQGTERGVIPGHILHIWETQGCADVKTVPVFESKPNGPQHKVLVFHKDYLAFFLAEYILSPRAKMSVIPAYFANWDKERIYNKVLELKPQVGEYLYGWHPDREKDYKTKLKYRADQQDSNLVLRRVHPEDYRIKPGTEGVITADGKFHLVDATSFKKNIHKKPLSLSDLKVVEQAPAPRENV